MEIIGLIASIATIVAAYPVYSSSSRRRRWSARRRALKQTPGVTPELRSVVRARRSDLRPSAQSGEHLAKTLLDALDNGREQATVAEFLARFHAALVDEDFSVQWSPPRLLIASGPPPAPPAGEPVDMIGRVEELEGALALVDGHRNIRICGPPGIGKSTLLRAIRAERPDSAYVRLEQGGEPMSDLRLGLNRLTGVPYTDDDAVGIDALVREVRDGTVLLVDNADEEESARAVERLAGHLSQLVVVVTTRAQSLEGFETLNLPPLAREDSVDLIADIGLSDDDTLGVLDWSGGNPQLTLQGAWAKQSGTTLDGQGRLEGLIEGFPADERPTLLLIGELPSATFPNALLVEVGNLSKHGLSMLQRNAVLRRDSDVSTVHQTLRVACQELTSTTATARERHDLIADSARYYSQWIDGSPSSSFIDATWPAIDHLLDVVDDERLRVDLALALVGDALDDPHGYIPTQGLGTLLLRHLERLEDAAEKVGGIPAARLEKNLGLFCFWAGNPRCKALLLRAEARFKEAGDLDGRASATWLLGNIADDACEFRKADALYRAPLEWLGASPARAVGLHLVGVHLYHQGKYEEARSRFLEAQEVAEDPGLRARIERRLAYIELAAGDTAAAIRKLETARATNESLHRPRDVARLNRHIAKGLVRLGQLDDAVHLLDDTRKEFLRLGDSGGVAATECVLASARRQQGRDAEAQELAKSSVAAAEGPNPPIEPMLSPLGVALGEDELGYIALSQGDRKQADQHMRRALNIYESVGHARAPSLRADLAERRDAEYPSATTVVFDLVDTLAVIDGDAYADVKRAHAEELGVDLQVFQEAWSRSRERSSFDASWTPEDRLRWVCDQIGANVSVAVLANLAQRERDLWSERVHLRPEAVALLDLLRGRGYRTGVLSNGSSAIARLATDLQLDTMVDAAAVSCQLGAVKPDPRAYRRLLERIPASPSESIFVGDGNDRELEGAKAAGMFAVRLRSSKPDYSSRASLDWDSTIENLEELAGALGGTGTQS